LETALKPKLILAAAASLAGCATAAHAGTVTSCESLASVALPNVTVTLAETVPAGSFVAGDGKTYTNMPSFCLFHGVASPSAASVINFEVWLPIDNWNGRFNGVGNGGLAGTISYSAMAPAVQQGFASASTDTGHTSTESPTWLQNPQRLLDFASRALHLTTVYAKTLIGTLYGTPAARSYYTGCSTGGRQGLMEAQRFPADYDGVVAGDPANNWTKQMDAEVWGGVATYGDNNLPTSKLPMINSAVLAVCAGHRGGLPSDAFLTNPHACQFDPAVLQCTGGDAPTCLTAPQVDAVRQMYSGPVNPRTGQAEYHGLPRGSEVGWGPDGGQFLIDRTIAQGTGVSSYAWFGYRVFNDPAWDYTTFDFDTDVRMNQVFAPVMNSTDPNLSAFNALGHKLVVYHGGADPLIPPDNTAAYYQQVSRADSTAGVKTPDYARFFVVPGVYHCQGGPGPNSVGAADPTQATPSFNFLPTLVNWVENGAAPQSITATRVDSGAVTFTRPLCSYPQVPVYDGSGNPSEASSFSCRAP
jgi:feruloyl esterase